MPLNNAEKCKNYRNRKKDAKLKIINNFKKTALTSAERSRIYRLRRKQLTQGIKSSVNEVLYTPSTSNSQMTLEPSPQPVTTVKACSPTKSDDHNIVTVFIDKNSIKTETEDRTDLISYGNLNIKDEENDVEEYINNNPEIDRLEIYEKWVNEIETKVNNKDIEKNISDKLNDNRIEKANCNMIEKDREPFHSLVKEKTKNNTNVNNSNNANEIHVKKETYYEFNVDNIFMPQENSPTNLTCNPDEMNNSDVKNENKVCYEEDYEIIFDDNSKSNDTNKRHLVKAKSKPNNSHWEKYALETPVLRELIATLLSVPYTNLNTVSQDLRCCTICSRTFDRPNNCKRHYIQHLLDDAYSHVVLNKGLRCQICGEVFSKNDIYKSHMRHHASLPVYNCDQCDKSFNDSSNFTKHKIVHKKSIHTCDVCKMKFNRKHNLDMHLEKHESSESIVCNVVTCNRVFYSQSSYIKHCRQEHLKQGMQYTCLVCKERFMTLKDKWDHQRTIF